MRAFKVYVKSHTTMPDYEQTIQAESVNEALDKFMKVPGLRELTSKEIAEYMAEVCPKCDDCLEEQENPFEAGEHGEADGRWLVCKNHKFCDYRREVA